jgi:hypothetical protein
MANTRDAINKVLRGIRQFGLIIDSGTSSTTDDYLLMVLQFVNEAKEEVEECGWPWYALRWTNTVTLSSGTAAYALTAGNEDQTDTNDRSRLLYEHTTSGSETFYQAANSKPQVFDTTDSSEERLTEVTIEKMERMHLTDDDQTGKPEYFAIYSDGTNLQMKVYPTPDATYTITYRVYVPQDELTNTVLTTTLSVPFRPVWMKALFKANEERGSELGRPGSSLYMAMLDAQGSAVGIEMRPEDQTVYLER